jgi:hypothetical protein
MCVSTAGLILNLRKYDRDVDCQFLLTALAYFGVLDSDPVLLSAFCSVPRCDLRGKLGKR